MACWGDTPRGAESLPSGETFVSLSADGEYVCGLRLNGTVWCRGDFWLPRSVPEGETVHLN